MRNRPTFHPFLELIIIRVKELQRDTDATFWVFVFPLLLTVGLGFAFRDKPPERIPIGVVDGPAAHQRIEMLGKSEVLQPRIYREKEGREQLRRGKISLLVEGDATPIYFFDPTRPDARAARIEVDDALQTGRGRRNVFRAQERHVSEQGARYIDFLVPGLIGMNLMGTGMWSIGYLVVGARLRHLIKRLVATPMRKSHYLLSLFCSRLVFLVLEVGVVAFVAWLIFGVTIRGSLGMFTLVCLLGGTAFGGIGLLTAARTKTIESISGIMNVVMMPMWICSGVFFSYERFPDAAIPLIRLLPLTALNDALRAVTNDGAGLMQIGPQLANLAIWAVISYTVALKIFRWT